MSHNGSSVSSLEDHMMAMSTMDGQDTPSVNNTPAPRPIRFFGPSPVVPQPITPSEAPYPHEVSHPRPRSPDLAAYGALTEFMDGYPSYFDSSIPEERRLRWAADNLPEEFKQFEAKRLSFEDERDAWSKEMEELKAKRLLILRKEVVRLWMDQEERRWEETRASWAVQKKAIEDILKQDVDKLVREVSHLRSGHVVGGARSSPLPVYNEFHQRLGLPRR